MTVRTLLLLRHAKSSWDEPLPDHDRPLAERGVRDAKAAGALLDELGWSELVLCSTAARTRQTWAYAVGDRSITSEIRYTERIYGASADELSALIAEVDAGVRTLMIIGHGPGLPELAEELTGPLPGKYATAGLARIELGGSWSEPGYCRLVALDIPRG